MLKRLLVVLLVLGSQVMPGAAMVSATADAFIVIARRGSETGVSLNEAVQQVQRETGGRVLSADTVNHGGRAMHRIKVLLPSGQVRVVTVGAQAGGR